MYSENQLYSFTRRTYKFLRDNPGGVLVKKIHERREGSNVAGTYEPATNEVALDYRRDIISTLIHELLHAFHPDWSETKVLIEERALINQLSARQIKNIIRAFAAVL